MIRRLCILSLLLTLVAACGGQQAVQPTVAPTVEATTAPEPTTPPTTVPEPTTEPTAPPTTVAQAVGNCPAGQRLFDHELLQTEPLCIPENPQRIVALDMASVEVSLLTGKEVVASAGWVLGELPLLHPPFAEALAGAKDVGYPANLELVAALKPDLILTPGGNDVGDSIDIDLAKDIAPLVIADPVIYEDWRLGMDIWTDVLNVSETYDQMVANYDTRVSELQAVLGDPGSYEISVVSTTTYGLMMWMPDTAPGTILSKVGLSRPESQSLVGEAAVARYQDKQYVIISEERIDLVDGDTIFYFSYASTDPADAKTQSDHIATFTAKPIWQSLSAVKAGKAYQVPGYWWRPGTYMLANKVIDDLFTNLTDTQATTPVLDLAVGAAAPSTP